MICSCLLALAYMRDRAVVQKGRFGNLRLLVYPYSLEIISFSMSCDSHQDHMIDNGFGEKQSTKIRIAKNPKIFWRVFRAVSSSATG